jgi:hypothetical protein
MENEKCLALIQLYKSEEVLWNSKSANYHNKSILEDAWKDISRELRNSVGQPPRFDAGHEHGKQMNEFAAHEQLRAAAARNRYEAFDVVGHFNEM